MDVDSNIAPDTGIVDMLRQSAASIVPVSGDLGRVRALRFAAPGYDRAIWSSMCEMGWAGLLAGEAAGGSGLGLAAACALLEELGAGLVPEPLLPAMIAAAALPGELSRPVMEARRLTVPATDHGTGQVVVASNKLSGRRTGVLAVAEADSFIVEASGRLFLVERGADGMQIAIQGTHDGGFIGTLHLDDVSALPLEADAAIVKDQAAMLLSACLMGVARRAMDTTVEYVKTRHQFGKAIGSFQAIQHKLADQHVQIALCRAALESTAADWDRNGLTTTERSRAVARCKVRAADTANLVTRQAIQLHGAMGFTDEAPIGLFARKAATLINVFGSSHYHRQRYGSLLSQAVPT